MKRVGAGRAAVAERDRNGLGAGIGALMPNELPTRRAAGRRNGPGPNKTIAGPYSRTSPESVGEFLPIPRGFRSCRAISLWRSTSKYDIIPLEQ
jgi:hypothetical protein